MPQPTTPTQTSYAVLGLLAIRPWTTYELARQSERSLRWFFPRAERAVYLEAKRLVDLGWARAKRTTTGRRGSTVYSITRSGTAALRAWLGTPSSPTEIVSEPALKLFFADQTNIDDVRAVIVGMREDAARSLATLAQMASSEGLFPERARTNVLSMRLITDLHESMHAWTDWALQAVDVLAKGDPRAVDRQTRRTLESIRSARANT